MKPLGLYDILMATDDSHGHNKTLSFPSLTGNFSRMDYILAVPAENLSYQVCPVIQLLFLACHG